MSYEKKYKGVLIFLAIIIFFWLFIELVVSSSPNYSNLNRANKSFIEKDYKDAATYYEKAIIDGHMNGDLLFLFGYCLEQTSTEEKIMKTCYKSSVFLYESDSETETEKKFYKKALNKMNLLGIENNASYEDISEIKTYINEKNNISKFDEFFGSFEFYLYLIFFLIIYIIALIVGDKTSCVIVYGKIDAFLLFIPCVSFFFLKEVSFSLVNIILGIWFIVATIFTIIGNIKSTHGNIFLIILYSFLSLLTKIALIFLVPLLAFIVIVEIVGAKADNRYRDGTRNNRKTALIAEAGVLFSILVLPLIKDKDDF